MRLKYSENPFLKINLFEDREHSLENEVLRPIIEYYSENEIDPDQIIKALKQSFFGKWIDDGALKPKMVGLVLFHMEKIINGKDLEIVFFVFPKWHITSQTDEEKTKLLVSCIRKYIQDNDRDKNITSSINDLIDLEIYTSTKRIDAMYQLICDVEEFGFLTEKDVQQSKNFGRINWRLTLKSKPFFSRNKPIYMNQIRERKSKRWTEITYIHERLFSYCMTHLNSLFQIQSSYPFYECQRLMDVENLRSHLGTAIDDAQVEHKINRIQKMLNVLDKAETNDPTNTKAWAVSSKRFDYLWEEILVATVGNRYLKDTINSIGFKDEFPLLVNGEKREMSAHKIDGILISERGEIVLFDAKNYCGEVSSIPELTKQIAYQHGINHILSSISTSPAWQGEGLFVQEVANKTVAHNLYIRPDLEQQSRPRSANPFTLAEVYNNEYLSRTFTAFEAVGELYRVKNDVNVVRAILADPYAIMDAYVKHNRLDLDFLDILNEIDSV